MAFGTEDPEGRRNRSSAWKTAALAALATLAVGAGTVGGALWGVSLTNETTAETARLEFLRPQQQELYAKFLDAVDRAELAIRDGVGSEPITSEELDAALASLDEVDDLVKELELLATDDTITAAQAVATDLHGDYRQMYTLYCDQPGAEECLPLALFVEIPGGKPAPGPREIFVDKARDDLGAEAD